MAIVLPAYNEEQVIVAAIEAALATPTWLPSGVELALVIVVNDGSTDATGRILVRLDPASSATALVVTDQRSATPGTARP